MENKVQLEQRIFWHNHKVSDRIHYQKDKTSFWSRLVKLVQGVPAESADDERTFMEFYLHNTKSVCTHILSVNCFLLLGTIYIITQDEFGSLHGPVDPTFRAFKPAAVGIALWLLLSSMCLAFFFVLDRGPHLFKYLTVSHYCEVWYELGAAIVFTRLLILITQIVRSVQSEDKCLDAADIVGSGDTTFGYMFIMMCLDTYLTFVLSAMPFPQPWGVALSITEMLRQLIRTHTCAHRITTQAEQMWIVDLLTVVILFTYLFSLLVPSIYLEGSFRNRFRGEKLKQEATVSKKEMVGFLSNDVRVPLQYVLHAVASVDFVRVAGDNVQPLLNDIHRHSGIVNEIADELLLLVRINENRYTSKLTVVPDLRSLLDSMGNAFLKRRFIQGRAAESGNAVESDPRDWLIEVFAPSVELQVDEQCVLTALRQLLAHLTQPAKGAEVQGDAPEAADVSIFRAATEKKALCLEAVLTADKLGVPSRKILTIKVTGDSLRTAKKDEESKVREATISYVCATIAQSCGGTFQRSPLAFMLSIPCQVRRAGAEETSAPVAAIIREEGADGGDSVGAGSFLTNARSSPGASPTDARAVDILKQAQVALDDKIRQSADVQERFRRKRVCAIVTDAVLEEVITAAITRMGLGAGLTVLHELQRGNYVPVAMVTFVTTYSLCVELRQRQYHGMIVLFSGSANYLDDAQFASVDYCMPLPCSDQHIGRFMDWLVEVHAKQEAIKAEVAATSATAAAARRQRATAGHQTARSEASFSVQSGTKTRPIGPDSLPLLVSPHYVVKSVIRAIRSTAASIQHAILSKDNFFLAVRLPPGTLESYTKWKLLNPSGSVYHHSTEITIVMFARFLISAILENTVVKHNRAPMALAMIACLMTMLRCISYRYILKPLGWHMYKYWLIPAALIGGYYVYVILQRTNYPAIRDMTLAEFQDTDFTPGRTGTHLLYGQIQSGTTARLYALYLTHPINTMLFILIFIRNSQTLWAVMRNIASIQMCEYIQLLLVQMTALNLVYQIHLENTYRREFIAAYHHILARAFLDQCLEICQQDIRKPLEYLLARKGDLMKVLQHAAQSRVLTVDRALMEKLEPLQVSHALLSEMVNELTYHPLLTSAENGSVRYSAEQVHLSHCVASLVAAFSSSLDDHHVQVVAEVDAQLAVVRVDWKMLSLVLTNLISAALRNIREYCIETPRRRDLLNTVFIKFTAIECSKNVPFVSPRLMLVNVCDSSSAASRVGRSAPPSDGKSSAPALAKAQDGSSDREMFRYGRGLCERLVRRVAVDSVRSVYQTLYSAESELQTVQRFTFPYHLCSQTHKAQDFLHGETSLPYLTIRVQPSTLLSAYTRIVRPCAPTQMNRHGLVFREPGEKRIVLLTSVDPKLRPGTMGLIARLQSGGWKCVIKYVLRVPSLASIGAADCVLIDQQLELQENVNICDTVLKLRVCGFSGIIAVALKEGLRKTDAIKEELSRSAVDADLIFTGLVTDMNIQSMTVALEKKCIAQALNKSEAYGERAARERERSVPQPGI